MSHSAQCVTRRSFVATSVALSVSPTPAATASECVTGKSGRWMVVADDDQDGLWLTTSWNPKDAVIAVFDCQNDAERFLAKYVDAF